MRLYYYFNFISYKFFSAGLSFLNHKIHPFAFNTRMELSVRSFMAMGYHLARTM